jgi:serine/threonine protein kinase
MAMHCKGTSERGREIVVGMLELGEDKELLSIVLERQLSYFGDLEAFNGFLQYLHNGNPKNPWIEIFRAVRPSFNAEYPREPFSLWQDESIDEDFRDVIMKMANFNPEKRITAQEALEHRWFMNASPSASPSGKQTCRSDLKRDSDGLVEQDRNRGERDSTENFIGI